MDCHPFKDVHIHRTGSMQEDLGFLPLAKPWQQFTQNRVFNGNNIQIGIRTYLFYIRHRCPSCNLSQGSSRLYSSTKYLHDIMTGSQKRLSQVGGQITSPYQNYLHDLPILSELLPIPYYILRRKNTYIRTKVTEQTDYSITLFNNAAPRSVQNPRMITKKKLSNICCILYFL